MEKPDPQLHQFLISSPCRFVGVFDSPALSIDLAWPGIFAPSGTPIIDYRPSPYSRCFFAVSVRIQDSPVPEGQLRAIPNYVPFADQVCIILSILFGKRFDNHGFFLTHQMFGVPSLNGFLPMSAYEIGPCNFDPRVDLKIELNIERFSAVLPLLIGTDLDDKFLRFLFAAGRFYMRSLQTFDSQPESAYLDLVTCGEVLSNFFEYDDNDILDANSKSIFQRIRSEMKGGDKIVSQLRQRFFQIKKRFTLSILRLVNDPFFENSESEMPLSSPTKDDIEKRIKAAYDLRSRYVHNGTEFGKWIKAENRKWEVQIGNPVVDDKEFGKILALAPTYVGLERIMRYCLIRLIHLYGVKIDPRLDDPS